MKQAEIELCSVSQGTARISSCHRSGEKGIEQILPQSLWKDQTLPTLEAGRDQEGFLPADLRESTALPTPWNRTHSIHNYETINSCCFKPFSIWYFLTAPPCKLIQYPWHLVTNIVCELSPVSPLHSFPPTHSC